MKYLIQNLVLTLSLLLVACTPDESSPIRETGEGPCFLVNQGNFYDNIAGTLSFPNGLSLLIGDTPQNAVLLDSLLYVPCYASSDLAVVSLATSTIRSRIPLVAPQHICTDGQRLFITQGNGTLAIVNPADLSTTSVTLGGSPYACVATAGRVFINLGTSADGLHSDGRVLVLNASSLALEASLSVAQNPYDQMAADADGNVFTICLGDYTSAPEVWQISPDLTTRPVATGNLIAAHGHTLYIAYAQADWNAWPNVTADVSYSTLDTRSGTLSPLALSAASSSLGTTGGGLYPSCLAVNPSDGNLYIASDAAPGNYNSPGSLHVFSPSGTHLASYPAGPHPYSIVFPTNR